jgi:protein involved in polysaccharide export with SLBB domain
MTAPKKESRLTHLELRGLPSRTNRPIALFIAASMVAFTSTHVVAKDVQASANIGEEASGLSKDYRLAPGDRLHILVKDPRTDSEEKHEP